SLLCGRVLARENLQLKQVVEVRQIVGILIDTGKLLRELRHGCRKGRFVLCRVVWQGDLLLGRCALQWRGSGNIGVKRDEKGCTGAKVAPAYGLEFHEILLRNQGLEVTISN